MSRSRPGEIPQIKRYKTRDLACIYIDGRRHYLGPWVTPVPAAYEEERLRLWTEHLAGQPNSRQGRVSVAVLVDRFLDHAEKTYRKNGRSTGSAGLFVYSVRQLLELYARTPADEFTPGALKAVRQHMLDTGWTTKFVDGTESERREYSRKLLNVRMGLIRQIFRWGVENGLVEVSTLSALEAVAPLKKGQSSAAERPRVRPVTPLPSPNPKGNFMKNDFEILSEKLDAVLEKLDEIDEKYGSRLKGVDFLFTIIQTDQEMIDLLDAKFSDLKSHVATKQSSKPKDTAS